MRLAAFIQERIHHIYRRQPPTRSRAARRRDSRSWSARQQYAHAVTETLYASCGDLSLAYQVFGDGPIELVFVGSFVSHVEPLITQ
jgi:hypothetical protein